ncbi:MAG: POT family proton-dependent oligopeptide transporter, partial [Francisellaceae bacterium]
ALWWLSLVYGLYAISYGVLFANLLIYSNQSPYINFSENHAFQFFGAFGTLTFVLPLLGGCICDKFGFLFVAKFGLALSVVGFVALSLDTKFFFFIGVAICLVGNALAMPAIWSMVGMIYKKTDSARESGATIFYLLFNIGFLVAFSSGSLVAVYLGYATMFLIFGAGSLLALCVLLVKGKSIHNLPEISQGFMALFLISILILVITSLLLSFLIVNNVLMWILTISAFIFLFYLSKRQNNEANSSSIKAFMFLCFLGIIGITIYNSEFGILPEFAHHAVNLGLGEFYLPGQIITSLDPLFCIVLGLLLGKVWILLGKFGKSPQLATKLTLGIILPALGYLVLVFAIQDNINAKLSLLWLLPIFILFVTGELLILPTGIAMAGRLAPNGKEGLFMGIWNVMQGFSSLITGYVAYFTVVKPEQSMIEVNMRYSQVFLYAGLVILVIGVIGFLLRNKINRLI